MKLLFVLLFTCISPLFGQAQESVLWKVSGNGLTTDSYILGTLKFIDKNDDSIPSKVVNYLKKCNIFAIEDPVDHHAQYELNKAIHFPQGESLATHLSQDDYSKVERFFKKEFHINKEKFKRKYTKITPLGLSIVMTRLSLHEQVLFYDIELLRMAKKNRIRTYSLEPIDREAKALHAFSIPQQITILMHSVNAFEEQKKSFFLLQQAFMKGNLSKAFDYSTHLFEDNESFMDLFYYERNEEWMPKIEKMFSDQKSFIAVGLLHLKGKRGLLELLKAKGYKVTPISLND